MKARRLSLGSVLVCIDPCTYRDAPGHRAVKVGTNLAGQRFFLLSLFGVDLGVLWSAA